MMYLALPGRWPPVDGKGSQLALGLPFVSGSAAAPASGILSPPTSGVRALLLDSIPARRGLGEALALSVHTLCTHSHAVG